ncbi:peptide MFS transporter [Paludibacterium paludis]|uniref:Dipeptide/tripeptide permease n=1 Tax=Paludibacterium paludis TaxID=1225769 RepID=A0A918NWR1_9NEIS|nr:peptide MFS transporter [Paludibacterium paludis]GGY03321.1 dipeptide/tripeptide permease [Paludibacterium paludis]
MTNKSHPKGLYLLFVTEMWERFSYYGMRAIFVLFMVKALMMDKVAASEIYGTYTGLVYFAPLIGGYIADRYWGNRRSIMLGGLLMAIGQFMLFFSGSLHGSNVQLATVLMYGGLTGLIVGNGMFKPNISSMVGQLYPAGDKRVDSAFTMFYMGINAGSLLAPLICGTLGDTGNPADFKWGFMAAGLGMLFSLSVFTLLKDKYLLSPEGKPVGLPPVKHTESGHAVKHEPLTRVEMERLAVILIVSAFVIFFWSAFEQAGASLTFFADEQTNRNVMGTTIPASFFQSINPIAIVLFAPVFAWLWTKLGGRGMEPSSPTKMALGLLFLAIGYLVIAFGVDGIPPGAKVSMMWLVSLYMLHSFGELCLSPIGLSLVVKLSPARFTGLMMGIWFLSNAISNKFAGMLSELYPEPGKAAPHFFGYAINNLHDFFMLFVVMAGVASLILFLLSSRLQKMMHGLQ